MNYRFDIYVIFQKSSAPTVPKIEINETVSETKQWFNKNTLIIYHYR